MVDDGTAGATGSCGAILPTRSNREIRRPNHSASSFMSSSSCALHSSFISLWYAQVTKVELRRTYGYELADIWWGASRVSGSGNLRLQEGSITLGQFFILESRGTMVSSQHLFSVYCFKVINFPPATHPSTPES
jgi:hypothetical protein